MSWNYAMLSQAAKAAGGPEMYALMLKESGRLLGHTEMFPWIGVTAGTCLLVGGLIGTAIESAKGKRTLAEVMAEVGTEGFVREMKLREAEETVTEQSEDEEDQKEDGSEVDLDDGESPPDGVDVDASKKSYDEQKGNET